MNNEEKILEILGQMQADMTAMKTDMTAMKTDMTAMKTDMSAMKERIDVIDDRSQRTAVLLEVEYKQQLDLLYEGHQAIMEALTPKERIKELEADISVLKMAVRTLSEELQALKKAQ